MTTRTMLVLGLGVFGFWAIATPEAAGIIAVIGFFAVLYQLHAIEVKLNKLLDKQGVFVGDADISRE